MSFHREPEFWDEAALLWKGFKILVFFVAIGAAFALGVKSEQDRAQQDEKVDVGPAKQAEKQTY